MPECIVCKGHYEVGQRCERCGADNSAWEEWKREEEGLGAPEALLHFLAPHLFLPLMVAGWALIFGLLGMLWPWGGVKPHVLVPVIAFTFIGCILAAVDIYEKRFDLREKELLRKIRRGRKKGIGIEVRTLLVPAIVLSLAMILTLSLIQSETLWELVGWLVLEPRPGDSGVEETPAQQEETSSEGAPLPQEKPDIQERFGRAFPLMCLSGYVTLVAFAYSSSLMLARVYARRLNERLPHPIFLQDEKLAQIVRREAEVELGRLDPKSTNVISLMGYLQFEGQTDPQILHLSPSVELSTAVGVPLSPQVQLWGQAATWVWDELTRTDDGGIEMKVARQEMYQLPQPTQNSGHRPHPRVCYVVRADPWGHIIEIKRDIE